MPMQFYTERLSECRKHLNQLQSRISLIAILRLISFCAFLVCIYWLFRESQSYVWAITVIFFISFIMLVRYNVRLNAEKQLLLRMIFINENELAIMDNSPNGFDDGSVYDSNAGYLDDLDIFGNSSLYQHLNRTTTKHGRDTLAFHLEYPITEKAKIESIQSAVKHFASQKIERQLITAHGLVNQENEGTLHDVLSWLKTKNILHSSKEMKIVRWALPVINFIALWYWLYADNYYPLVISIFITWSFIAGYAKHIKNEHTLVGRKQPILDQYSSILKQYSKVDTGNSILLKEQHSIAKDAYTSIKKLSALTSMLDQRLNLLVNILLNSFLMYDIQCLFALEKWKVIHRKDFNSWIECVGMIEYLNSLATFSFNNPHFPFPELSEAGVKFYGAGLAHPLIPSEERVANDVSLGENKKAIIITGSNMSGKTTFLRTVGVNLLLGEMGAPVCASFMSFTPMHILSAIRVNDSLQDHTSYFMAELKKLHAIIKYLSTGQKALVLVDEILRGTNSDDKTHCSEQFIQKIMTYNCLTLFATHDLSLSTLEHKNPGIANCCFESNIEYGELSFDYTLRPGVAKNKNASFLMKKMEII